MSPCLIRHGTILNNNPGGPGNFTNWAWGDIDVLFGDLAGLLDASDLDDYDILSFNPGYGWYYTQGQFAILKNTDTVLSSWQVRPLPHTHHPACCVALKSTCLPACLACSICLQIGFRSRVGLGGKVLLRLGPLHQQPQH